MADPHRGRMPRPARYDEVMDVPLRVKASQEVIREAIFHRNDPYWPRTWLIVDRLVLTIEHGWPY